MKSPHPARRPLRLKPPRWRDPRVLIGAVLVVASLLGTVALVRAAAQTVRVWAAAETLVPGEEIRASQLVAVDAKLPANADSYLSADALPAAGMTVRSVVAAGELLPAGALISADVLGGRIVSVDLSAALPASIGPGSTVDAWAVDASGVEQPEPVRILSAVDVISVDRAGSGFADVGGERIEVLVDSDDVDAIVGAQAGGHHISVVEVPKPQAAEG